MRPVLMDRACLECGDMNRRTAYAALSLCLPLVGMWPGMTDAQSLPAAAAGNAVPAQPGGGLVPPGPDGRASIAAIEAAVRADAVARWRLAAGAPLELRVEALVWPDGSLGCPQPGLFYTQALVPGWRLVLKHQDRVAVYHASQRGQWLLCPGADPAPRPGDSRI